MYLEELSRILDLENTSDAFTEAVNKLTNTWIKVNKQIVYVVDLKPKYIDTYSSTKGREIINKEEIKTIDLWNPESGVYTTNKGGHLLLQKKPRRQWQRSFRKENYHIVYLENCSPDDETTIIEESRTDFWFSKHGDLFFHDMRLGLKEGNKVKCNRIFVQDVKDWLKNEKNVRVLSI